MLKIWCQIYRSLFSFHTNSYTWESIYILSHNLATTQDIATAVNLASVCEANGGPFPMHQLPIARLVNKEFLATWPSCNTSLQPLPLLWDGYGSIPLAIANHRKVDSNRLPAIYDNGEMRVHGHGEEIGSEVHRL